MGWDGYVNWWSGYFWRNYYCQIVGGWRICRSIG